MNWKREPSTEPTGSQRQFPPKKQHSFLQKSQNGKASKNWTKMEVLRFEEKKKIDSKGRFGCGFSEMIPKVCHEDKGSRLPFALFLSLALLLHNCVYQLANACAPPFHQLFLAKPPVLLEKGFCKARGKLSRSSCNRDHNSRTLGGTSSRGAKTKFGCLSRNSFKFLRATMMFGARTFSFPFPCLPLPFPCPCPFPFPDAFPSIKANMDIGISQKRADTNDTWEKKSCTSW